MSLRRNSSRKKASFTTTLQKSLEKNYSGIPGTLNDMDNESIELIDDEYAEKEIKSRQEKNNTLGNCANFPSFVNLYQTNKDGSNVSHRMTSNMSNKKNSFADFALMKNPSFLSRAGSNLSQAGILKLKNVDGKNLFQPRLDSLLRQNSKNIFKNKDSKKSFMPFTNKNKAMSGLSDIFKQSPSSLVFQNRADSMVLFNDETPRAITRQLSNIISTEKKEDPDIKVPLRRSDRKNKWYLPPKESVPKEKTSNDGKESRWSKEDDRRLFVEFEKMIKAAGLKIEDFTKPEKRMSKQKKDILERLKADFEWRGTIYSLRNRIKKRIKSNDFTAREQRVLKRKLREYHNGKLTLQQIADHFAGKNVEQVEKFKKKYFKQIGLE